MPLTMQKLTIMDRVNITKRLRKGLGENVETSRKMVVMLLTRSRWALLDTPPPGGGGLVGGVVVVGVVEIRIGGGG